MLCAKNPEIPFLAFWCLSMESDVLKAWNCDMKVSSLLILLNCIKNNDGSSFQNDKENKKELSACFERAPCKCEVSGAILGNSVTFCAKAGVTQTLLFHFKVEAQINTALKPERDFHLESKWQSLCCKVWCCGRVHPALLNSGLLHSRLL